MFYGYEKLLSIMNCCRIINNLLLNVAMSEYVPAGVDGKRCLENVVNEVVLLAARRGNTNFQFLYLMCDWFNLLQRNNQLFLVAFYEKFWKIKDYFPKINPNQTCTISLATKLVAFTNQHFSILNRLYLNCLTIWPYIKCCDI